MENYTPKKREKPKIMCRQCNSEFKTDRGLERHGWANHPSNEYEKLWSRHEREGWVNWTGSTYFQDNPYY